MSEEVRLEIPEELSQKINSIIKQREKAAKDVQIDENLSIEEMKERIIELNNNSVKLQEEIDAYKKIIRETNTKKNIEEQSKLIGHCFKRVGNWTGRNVFGEKYDNVIAFYIISIVGRDEYNSKYAECRCLTKDKDEYSLSVSREELPVWKSMSHLTDTTKFIDLFEEITYEEFYEMYEEWLDKING